MKFTIFSDTHLSEQYSPETFAWLKYMIGRSEKIIINGDFWDKHLGSIDAFVASSWQPLFSLLKAKAPTYLIGNHDSSAVESTLWQVFANSIEKETKFSSGGISFIVTHGHLQSKAFDARHPGVVKRFSRFFPNLDSLEGKHSIRAEAYTSYITKEHLDRHAELTEYCRAHFEEQTWRIFGHTHLRIYDPLTHYINPGRFGLGFARWIEIENGSVNFFEYQLASKPPKHTRT